MRVLGLTTAAGLDAVTMAVLKTDGREIRGFGPAGAAALPTATAEALLAAAEGFLAAHGLGWSDLDLIGLSGRLVDAAWLARRTGAPVAHDFAAGGEGTPLIAVYHRARARASGLERPLAVLDAAHITHVAANGLLTALDAPGDTSEAVALGLARCEAVRSLVVCGDGRRDPQRVAALKARLAIPVLTAEEAGWRGDAIEAEAIAYLAVRTWNGLPIAFPGTTGVESPMTGGRIARP